MALNKQEQQRAEELSFAIDALNTNEKVQAAQEVEELAAVARLVKTSGAIDKNASEMIANTVDILSAELTARRRKRRWTWSFSGAVGIIAAGWLLITLNANFFMTTDPNSTYSQNPTTDLAQIVQIEREQEAPINRPENKLPDKAVTVKDEKPQTVADAGVERREAAMAKPGANEKAPEIRTAKQQTVAIADNAAKSPTERKMLALAGKSASSTTIDKTTGEIRQIYRMASGGEVTLVQGGKAKAPEAAAATAPTTPALRATGIAADKQNGEQEDNAKKAEQKTETLNRVTVAVDGEEATIEGKLPEEELKKIADTIVKQ